MVEIKIYDCWKRAPQAKPIKYVVTGAGCWECLSHCRNYDGYTQMRSFGKTVRLHCVAYELEKGPIKSGNVVRHLCDNPCCFNPDHLEQGTQHENVLDMVQKGRGYDKSGTNNPRSILTEKDVYEIKHLLKFTRFYYREIAAMYGVEKTAIYAIKNNKRFKHILI